MSNEVRKQKQCVANLFSSSAFSLSKLITLLMLVVGIHKFSVWIFSGETEGTILSSESIPVFCYGSNSVEQLRERCENTNLVSYEAELMDYSRAYAGFSMRWDGAVATILKSEGDSCPGSVVYMSPEDIRMLDPYEGCELEDPTSDNNVYKQVTLDVIVVHKKTKMERKRTSRKQAWPM